MKLPRVAIGIDIGTTNCRVGVWQNGKVDIIGQPNVNGDRHGTIPSYVAFTDTGERLVGEAAKNQIVTNPTNTIVNVKRVIGRKFDDPKLRDDMKQWAFKVVECEGRPMMELDLKTTSKEHTPSMTKRLTPEEVSSMILTKLKDTAESFLGLEVTDAVITVPANFNDSQRQATMDAALIAGLNVLHIINEPTAAALCYGLLQKNDGKTTTGEEKNVLIFDLGGGKLDVSIVTIYEGSLFEVRATSGDTQLGGEDFDTLLLHHLVQEFKRKYKKDLTGGHHNHHHGSIKKKRALRRLRTACERAKRSLSMSTTTEASVDIDGLLDGVDFHTKISRARFEQLCSDLFKSTMYHVDRVLGMAHMDKRQIDDILLVGGSTRIPRIQKLLQEHFNGRINLVDHYDNSTEIINPTEAVVHGAAVQAAIRSKTGSDDDDPFSYPGSVPQEMLVVDVSPYSCSLEMSDGQLKTFVRQNSRIPSTHSQTLTTFYDNQPILSFQVFEASSSSSWDDPSKNNSKNVLGTFTLHGISPAERGMPQIKVILNMDSNGILHVQTMDDNPDQCDEHQHQNQVIVESDKGRLTKQEIDRMVKEAKFYKAEDDKERERVAVKNQLEIYLLKIKHLVVQKDFAHKNISTVDKREVVKKCGWVLKWLDDDDNANDQLSKISKEEFENKFKEIQNQFQPILVRIMETEGDQQRQQQQQEEGEEGQSSKNGFHRHVDENFNCIPGPSLGQMMEW